MKIIGLGGKKGAGKDTIADILVKHEGYEKVAFADPLKALLVRVFGYGPQYYNDQRLKEADFPGYITLDHDHIDSLLNIVCFEWGYALDSHQVEAIERFVGEQFKTPRQLMQTVGTEICRNCIRDDIWLLQFISGLNNRTKNIVVCDVRLENERKLIQTIGGKLILIKRNEEMRKTDSHISENSLGKEADYDVIIDNTRTKDEMRSEILLWYSLTMKYV